MIGTVPLESPRNRPSG